MKRTKSAHKLYVPLDHDVIDSPAYADLSPSTKNVLILIARQWSPATNGKLQATFSFCKQRGIGSQHTLQKAVAELISHGLICRTRSHGLDPRTGKNRPALYAITWRPIKLRDKPTDIFTSGFVFEAYKKWSCEKKSGRQKVQPEWSRNCTISPQNRQFEPLAVNAVSRTQAAAPEDAQTADYEILAINKDYSDDKKS